MKTILIITSGVARERGELSHQTPENLQRTKSSSCLSQQLESIVEEILKFRQIFPDFY